MPWLVSLAGGIWGKVAVVGAALLALAIAVARIFSAGKKAERAANTETALKVEHERRQVDVDVAGADGAERLRLRNKWTAR